MTKWRSAACLLATWLMAAAPVAAEHSPHFDVTCPTGSAHVVLDPGHGGADPGAVRENPDFYEREMVLQIAEQAQEIIERESGVTVALTRTDNTTDLGNSERGEIANACGARLYISIHLNAWDDPTLDRAQVFWGEKEKDLAATLVMREAMGQLGIPLEPLDRFDNGGLLRARMPAVLVEPAFMTNPDEAAALVDGTRQPEIARAVADGVLHWLQITGVIPTPAARGGE